MNFRTSIKCCCLAMLLGCPPFAAAELTRISLTAGFDDNLGFARAQTDIIEDTSLQAAASWNWHKQKDVRLSTDWNLDVAHQFFHRTDGFDRTEINLGYALNRKVGLGNGLTKPLLGASASTGYLYSQESFRSGVPLHLQLGARSRLENGWLLRYQLAWSGFEPDRIYDIPVGSKARSGDTWRWRQLSLGGSLVVPLSQRFALLMDASLIDGDLVFSAQPTDALTASADAIAPDHALGASNYAYRLSGKAGQLEMAASYRLDASHSLELRMVRIYARSDGGIGYDRTSAALVWSRSF